MSSVTVTLVFIISWVVFWFGFGLYMKKTNQPHAFKRGFIIGLFLAFIFIIVVDHLFTSKKANEKLESLSVPSVLINPENSDFVKNYLPQVEQQCPGLKKYKDDWKFEKINSTGFTLLVSSQPINDKLWKYRSPSNRCFFDLSDDGQSIFIPKRACASLCKDELIDDSSYKIQVNAIRGKDDSSSLTQQERKSILSSLGAMMVWIGEKNENDAIIEKISNSKSNEETDKYLLEKYLGAKNIIEKKAMTGDYQSQRNIAYMYSHDSKNIGGNKVVGCAWYLILFASGSPKVDTELDKSNIDIFCSNKYLTDSERNEAFDIARKGSQVIYKSTNRFDQVYNTN
ncbi:hypothetical protein [Acinetobacter ursingii]|uniref:hypothetical protein n=1 Tax=Acinetobacter ursingii TaxID=108980 RepID=UPI003AF6395C